MQINKTVTRDENIFLYVFIMLDLMRIHSVRVYYARFYQCFQGTITEPLSRPANPRAPPCGGLPPWGLPSPPPGTGRGDGTGVTLRGAPPGPHPSHSSTTGSAKSPWRKCRLIPRWVHYLNTGRRRSRRRAFRIS